MYNVAYFTASVDSVADNTKFGASLGLDYPILSDPGTEVAQAYGVVHAGRKFPERWTFYIDKEGVIRKIDKGVKPGSAGEDVAKSLKGLKIAD